MLKAALLALGFILMGPVILAIAVSERVRLWRHGPAPTPFPPEHPESARAWADTMERGRRLQAQEDRDG